MKAQELRIGNLVQDRKGNICKVEALEKDDIKAYAGALTSLPLEPIPLTKEWLERFGFNYRLGNNGNLPCYKKQFNSKNITIARWKIHDIDLVDYQIWIDTLDITKINYVHQIQNLYFSLTGKELELKK